jgi:hypothetical protein
MVEETVWVDKKTVRPRLSLNEHLTPYAFFNERLQEVAVLCQDAI